MSKNQSKKWPVGSTYLRGLFAQYEYLLSVCGFARSCTIVSGLMNLPMAGS